MNQCFPQCKLFHTTLMPSFQIKNLSYTENVQITEYYKIMKKRSFQVSDQCLDCDTFYQVSLVMSCFIHLVTSDAVGWSKPMSETSKYTVEYVIQEIFENIVSKKHMIHWRKNPTVLSNTEKIKSFCTFYQELGQNYIIYICAWIYLVN